MLTSCSEGLNILYYLFNHALDFLILNVGGSPQRLFHHWVIVLTCPAFCIMSSLDSNPKSKSNLD